MTLIPQTDNIEVPPKFPDIIQVFSRTLPGVVDSIVGRTGAGVHSLELWQRDGKVHHHGSALVGEMVRTGTMRLDEMIYCIDMVYTYYVCNIYIYVYIIYHIIFHHISYFIYHISYMIGIYIYDICIYIYT